MSPTEDAHNDPIYDHVTKWSASAQHQFLRTPPLSLTLPTELSTARLLSLSLWHVSPLSLLWSSPPTPPPWGPRKTFFLSAKCDGGVEAAARRREAIQRVKGDRQPHHVAVRGHH
jgi:hypothetical protein